MSAQPYLRRKRRRPLHRRLIPRNSAQLLQSMARDLATMGQQIEQLNQYRADKASQEQISRSAARTAEIKPAETRPSETRAPEQSLRPRVSALPPRPAAAPVRRPRSSYPPAQATGAPALPPAVTGLPPVQPELARARNGSAGRRTGGAATDAPAMSEFDDSGRRNSKSADGGMERSRLLPYRPRISHALLGLRRVIRLRGLDR